MTDAVALVVQALGSEGTATVSIAVGVPAAAVGIRSKHCGWCGSSDSRGQNSVADAAAFVV